MTEEQKDPVTIEDLEYIFIRAQNAQGSWLTVSVKEATHRQFSTWAASRMAISGDINAPWPLSERAAFCDQLWQAGTLHLLKKDGRFEDEPGEES